MQGRRLSIFQDHQTFQSLGIVWVGGIDPVSSSVFLAGFATITWQIGWHVLEWHSENKMVRASTEFKLRVSQFDESSAELCNVPICACMSDHSCSSMACCSGSTSSKSRRLVDVCGKDRELCLAERDLTPPRCWGICN